MTILQQVDADFVAAMKSKDERTLSALRMMRSALKNKQIDAQHDLTDAEVIAVLKTMLKQYQDALRDFQQAARQDLVEKQQTEIDLLQHYLPPVLSAEELKVIVRQALSEATVQNVGQAMGVAMKAVDGRADGNQVRELVQAWMAEKN